MADQAVTLDDDAEDNCVVVAVGCGGDDAEAVSAGFALHPELFTGAGPEGDEAGFEGFGVAEGVEEAEHQHFAGGGVLDDAGDQAVHFVEIDCGQFGVHDVLILGVEAGVSAVAWAAKSPLAFCAGGLLRILPMRDLAQVSSQRAAGMECP